MKKYIYAVLLAATSLSVYADLNSITITIDAAKSDNAKQEASQIRDALVSIGTAQKRVTSDSFSYTVKCVQCSMKSNFAISLETCVVPGFAANRQFTGEAARIILSALRNNGVGSGSIMAEGNASAVADSITCTESGANGQNLECVINAKTSSQAAKS